MISEIVFMIVNDAAQAYRGVIPADRWNEPYMPLQEMEHEINQGVRFAGIEADGVLVGIIGVQPVKDVTLISHAYIATAHHGKGLGGVLHLLQATKGLILVGTWATRFTVMQQIADSGCYSSVYEANFRSL